MPSPTTQHPAKKSTAAAAAVATTTATAAATATGATTVGSKTESPVAAQTKKQKVGLLDQELLVLERDDGKRHSRELSACLMGYAKKIDELQAKNRRLEEELSFDDHVTREDPFFNDQTAEKLSNLYLQGNNFMIRLELERKEVARLNALIQSHESVLARQKTKLYELAALDHNHAVLLGRVRKMEHDVDRRIVKMNEKLHRNRRLRETIDAHRTERARMDAMYTKISSEMLSKRHKVARLSDEVDKARQEITAVEQELEDVRQEGEDWEAACDRRAAILLQELKEIAVHQKDAEELADLDKYKFLGENDIMRHMSAAQENVLQSRAKRSRWKTGQAKVTTDVMLTKYQENRTYIEKIHEVSGTKTVSEMIDAFNNQEVEHFDRIQHVNQLAEEIENHRQVSAKLREEIGKLKQRKDSVDFQRMNRIEGLRSKLQTTNDQKKLKEDANHELQGFLAALKPAVLLFHSRIGCSDVHNDGDMKKVLGEIEEQIVTVLQAYHAKVEVTRKETKAQEDVVASTSLSPQPAASHSRRKPSMAVRSRRGSVAPRALAEAITESESTRLGTPTEAAHGQGPRAGPSTTGAAPRGLSATSTGAESTKTGGNAKTVKALLSKQQPYRYTGLRPPHLSMEELRKKDNMEEEYPLTYHELKVKVWHNDAVQ